MKKLALFTLVALSIVACTGNKNASDNEEKKTAESAMTIGNFMKIAHDSIGKEVKLMGTVNHICSHSGRRCFIIDTVGNQSIRIEATGNITGFNRELSGMDIKVTGIVRENRLTTKYIDDWELKLKSQEEDPEDGGEHCAAELANIKEMRDWMKAHNKDYYSIIYVDGTDYEVMYKNEL